MCRFERIWLQFKAVFRRLAGASQGKLTQKCSQRRRKCTFRILETHSNSGNTKKLAEAIRDRFGAELIFVEPERPYGGFISAVKRVIGEHKRGEQPVSKTRPMDFRDFDLVFLGFPVWAGEMPQFMQSYLKSCTLSGKAVVPFATAMGSGKESALRSVRALLPDCAISNYYYANKMERPDVSAWLDGVARDFHL